MKTYKHELVQMLEKLKVRVERWIIGLIDGYAGKLISGLLEHPENLEQFYPIADKFVARYLQHLSNGQSASGEQIQIPLEQGIAKMLPKKFRWASPFIAPYAEQFLQGMQQSKSKQLEARDNEVHFG